MEIEKIGDYYYISSNGERLIILEEEPFIDLCKVIKKGYNKYLRDYKED